jgi:transposase
MAEFQGSRHRSGRSEVGLAHDVGRKGHALRRCWALESRKTCEIKGQCATGKEGRITRWDHEAVIEAMQLRLDRDPLAIRTRRQTVEHVFGTLMSTPL